MYVINWKMSFISFIFFFFLLQPSHSEFFFLVFLLIIRTLLHCLPTTSMDNLTDPHAARTGTIKTDPLASNDNDKCRLLSEMKKRIKQKTNKKQKQEQKLS